MQRQPQWVILGAQFCLPSSTLMRTTSTLLLTALALTVACGSAPEPVAVRLVDLFQPDVVAGSPTTQP